MLYVDGCSFIAGVGLSEEYKLSNLLKADKDMSIEGKSNLQIIHDLHLNIENYTHFVLSFTFDTRTVVFLEGTDRFHILPGIDTGRITNKWEFEKYKHFHEFYYRHMNINFTAKLHDFYVDGAISLLKYYNKQYVIYSAEPRDSKFKDEINLLHFYPEYKNYDNHFNEEGMLYWAADVKKKLNYGK